MTVSGTGGLDAKKQIKGLGDRPPLFRKALSGLLRHEDRKIGKNYAFTHIG